ncbi:DUF2079 domain-containing protein [Candidatus Roizmanbacteria bacterium]|nr:DUF2079 domain-containing protein [Candidatus Roizmanbacteria bacterium]
MQRVKKIVLVLFFLTFFILFSCISLWRFNTGQVFYYDFGHYARIMWLISRFLPPIINHKVLGEIHFFGDHFIPGLYLIAPLFWATAKLQVLLIQQVLATVFAGFLVYKIVGKEKLPFITSLIISFIFLLFAGVENPLVTDWHTESTAVAFLLLFIYLFFYRKKGLPALVCAVIFMSLKDSNPLSFLFMLIPYFFIQKEKRKEIIFYVIFALLWFVIGGYILTPAISKQPYLYSPVLPSKPWEFVTNFVNLPIKRKLIFDSLASFGFLPVFSGVFLLPIIAELSIRLVPTYIHSQSFTLGMHYNVFLGAFLTIATIQVFSTIHLKTKRFQMGLIILLLLVSLFVAKKITRPPLLLATNSVFWKEWNVKAELFNEIKLVPVSGSVMSQNNILPHLVQRKEKVYLLSLDYKKYQPQTIMFDLAPGQNINNYYSGEIRDIEQVLELKRRLLNDKDYLRVTTLYKDLYLFKRNVSPK